MAQRRMFSKLILDSDAFLDMPSSSQMLYTHLAIRADDDGFVGNPKKIQRMIGAADDDAKLLLAKNFIISFETGVIVIKHWRIHNYIQNDRYTPTLYQAEASTISVDVNKIYSVDKTCLQDVSNMVTQVRLGQVRLGKNNSPCDHKKKNILDFKTFKKNYIKKYDNQNTTIAMSDGFKHLTIKNGYLFNMSNFKDLSADNAKEVWKMMYEEYLRQNLEKDVA